MTSTLARNLVALSQPPDSLSLVTDPDIRVEGPDDRPDAFVRDARGAWLRLHSGRVPEAEARTLVDALVAKGSPHTVVVLGAGLGYVVDALEAMAPAATVHVVEPSPVLVRAFLSRRDWTSRIVARQLLVFSGPDFVGPPWTTRVLEDSTSPAVLAHPVLGRVWPDRLADALRRFERRRFALAANAEGRRRLAAPYLLNTLSNLAAIGRESDASALDGIAARSPAIVIAAGPSLDNHLETLATVRESAWLISVDTALRPLTRAGLAPDLVVAVDPSQLNARHLTSCTVGPETYLVAEASIWPSGLQLFAQRTFFFRIDNHHPWPWLVAHGIDVGRLRAWGSVLSTAVDLACRMQADPVILVGADLAFSSHGSHCRGVAHEEIWALHGLDSVSVGRQAIASSNRLTRLSIDGVQVSTLPHLLSFRDWLIENVPDGCDVVNATAGGLLQGGRVRLGDLATELAGATAPDRVARLAGQHAAGRRRNVSRPVPDAATRDVWRRETPSLDATALDLAAREAPVLPHPGAQVATPDPPVTAAVHALLHKRTPPIWAREALSARDIPGGGLTECLQLAHASLCRLLALDCLCYGARPASKVLLAGFAGAAPISALFAVSPEAVADVMAFECALAHLAARVPAPAESGVWPQWPHRPTLGPDVQARALVRPWDGESGLSGLTNDAACEALARWLLIVAFARAEALLTPTGRADGELADVLFTAMQTCARVGGRASVTLTAADGAEIHTGASADFADWMLGRALTGSLIVAGTDAAPTAAGSALTVGWHDSSVRPSLRRSMLKGPRWRTPAIDLAARGLPPCGHLIQLPDGHVLATPFGSTHGWHVTADGTVLADEVHWPLPISGVTCLGDTRVAWSNDADRCTVLVDEHGTIRTVARLDFRVTRLAAMGAGRVVASSFSGACAFVDLATSRTELASIPLPGVALNVASGSVVVAEARLGRDGHVSRTVDAIEWTLEDEGTWLRGAAPAAGAAWAVASRGGWSATAHPASDALFITHRGVEAFLAVYFPTCVAWAGDSLVVTTADGDVLMFPELLATLDQAVTS